MRIARSGLTIKSRWEFSIRKHCNRTLISQQQSKTERIKYDASPSTIQQLRRYFSSPTTNGQQRPLPDEKFPHEQHGVPKYAAVASMLMIPLMFGACQLSDYIFENRQIGMNEQLRQEFEQHHSRCSVKVMPTLFCCIIRRTHGFTHCLSGVRIGDVVEILEEGVGPEQAYNLCRIPVDHRDSVSEEIYGWFPYRWLEKLDHYEEMVQKQRAHNNKWK
jgi:hypothetical protein